MKKYLKYEAADFAEDPDFIKWVQSDFEDQATNWNNFMEENPGLGDEISQAIDDVELFHFEEAEVPKTQKDNLLARINNTLEKEQKLADVKVEKPTVPQTNTASQTTPRATPQAKPTPTTPKPTPEASPASSTVDKVAPRTSNPVIKYLLPIAAAVCLGAVVFFNVGGAESTPLTKNTVEATTTNVASSKSTLTFDKKPLSSVILELEKQFNLVVTTNAGVNVNKKFTGSFETRNLKNALQSVVGPMGLKYSIDAKGNNGKKSVMLSPQ